MAASIRVNDVADDFDNHFVLAMMLKNQNVDENCSCSMSQTPSGDFPCFDFVLSIELNLILIELCRVNLAKMFFVCVMFVFCFMGIVFQTTGIPSDVLHKNKTRIDEGRELHV